MALIWPLQQASRMDEFEPPTGTAHEGSVVGGAGIWEKAMQDMMFCLAFEDVVERFSYELGNR